MSKRLWNNQAGNTIAIVLVSIAILSGLSYTILTQINTTKKSVKSIQVKKDRLLLERQISAYFTDIDVCNSNLAGRPITGSYNSLQKNGKNVLVVGFYYKSLKAGLNNKLNQKQIIN